MKLHPKLEKTIDIVGLLIALIVDLIVIPICMLTLAPDFLTKIAFVCIGVTIVLFVFRSWAKGQKGSWLIFTVVVFFFDYSFALVTTQAQTNKQTVTIDSEIVKIEKDIYLANEQIKKLRDERTISTRPETIASISEDIKTEERNIEIYRDDKVKRQKAVEKSGGVYITADSVFTSIPDALSKKRYIPLIVFGFIFLGLQAVVVTSIDSPDKKKRETKQEEIKEESKKVEIFHKKRRITLEFWVKILWSGEKAGKPRIPSETLVIQYCQAKGIDLPIELHQKYLKDAVDAKLISPEGILWKNEEKSLEVLKKLQ